MFKQAPELTPILLLQDAATETETQLILLLCYEPS